MRTQAVAVLAVLSVLLAADASFGYYNQSLGRWTSEDSLGVQAGIQVGTREGEYRSVSLGPSSQTDRENRLSFAASTQYSDGMNLYQYVHSCPIMRVDPLGRLTGFAGCSMCQKNTLEADAKMAQKQIWDLKDKINAALAADAGQYPWFTHGKLEKAIVTLDQAAYALRTAKVECACTPGPPGWHASSLGNTITVYPTDLGFWWTNYAARAAGLVHEATHVGAGIGDHGTYFLNAHESPHDVSIFGWDIIASTYDTWILTGFCIPGYNCPDTVYYNHWQGFKTCP
jgi:hypothetical protein